MMRSCAILPAIFSVWLSASAQIGCSVSGKFTGFSLTENTGVSVSAYSGFGYTVFDSAVAAKDGTFIFPNKFNPGFYQLSVPVQGITGLFYVGDNPAVYISIEETEFQTDRFHFGDAENSALTELLNASKQLEFTLNTLNESFNPAQIDSFYLQKLVPHYQKVQHAYRTFNSKVDEIGMKYPKTAVAEIYSSFFPIPLFEEDSLFGKYYDNQDAYLRDHFFDLWKMNNADVTRFPEVKRKIEKYFRFFAKKNFNFLTHAVDHIMELTPNEEVRVYLASLMIDFFTQVKENDVVAYLVENKLKGCLNQIDLSQIHFNRSNLRGTKVTPLELPCDKGGTVSLQNVYASHPLTLLYFWKTDCIHCRDLHPVVKNLANTFRNKLAVYNVCLEDNEKNWRTALNEYQLPFNNCIAAGEKRKIAAQQFGIKYTPLIFLVNRYGEIAEKDLYSEDLEKAISGILK